MMMKAKFRMGFALAVLILGGTIAQSGCVALDLLAGLFGRASSSQSAGSDGSSADEATTPSADELSPGDGAPPETQPPLSPAGLPLGTVSINEHRFQVEIAETADAVARGMMDRRALDRDAGMLFIFSPSRTLSFWMVNTYIPLDIAFFREDGSIINMDTMTPLTLTSHRSAEPAKFALEVNAGELERRGIRPGDVAIVTRP